MKEELLIKDAEEKEIWKEYGYLPKERPVPELIKYGIVNLNKPKGPTSHQVTAWVKKILEIRKAGHAGTLD